MRAVSFIYYHGVILPESVADFPDSARWRRAYVNTISGRAGAADDTFHDAAKSSPRDYILFMAISIFRLSFLFPPYSVSLRRRFY